MNNLTIVMYHYVRDLKNSRYPEINGLDLHLFKEQVNYLRKNYHILSMEEVLFSIDNQSKIPSKSVLLTFDDAYSDHYKNVFPILDQYKIQGSFYAPSKAISENVLLDVNKIHFILAAVKNKLDIIYDLRNLIEKYKDQYQLDEFDNYYKTLAHATRYDSKEVAFIKSLLQVTLIEELRLTIVDTLFQKYIGISETALSREVYMSEDQLKHMIRSGQHIGSHGHNHYWWNSLSKKEMNAELDLSLKFLKRIGVDMRNWTACYPYGSFDDQSISMLREKGCKLALTTEVDIAKTDKNVRFLMPRLDTNDLPKNENAEKNHWYSRG